VVQADAGLALIFDMDGVIIDSNPLHGEVWREYLKKFGVSADGIDTRMQGKRNDQIVRELFGPALSEDEVFAHGAGKEALYRERMTPEIEANLMPGLRELLEANRGLALGVGSNAEPANVDFVLDGAGLRPYFGAVVDGHQVEHPKPAPDIYLKVARILGRAPGNCVIFEDSASGIAAGRAMGARVVGVCRKGQQLANTDLSIVDFADPALRSWLGSQVPI
jgi:beta-phosphoglucomutase